MTTLRQLRYLVALSRHRHFGRAAEECAVSQPALSVQIQELEADLDAVLVERGRGRIALLSLPLGQPDIETVCLFVELGKLLAASRAPAWPDQDARFAVTGRRGSDISGKMPPHTRPA